MTKTKMMGLAAASLMSTAAASQAVVVVSETFDALNNGTLSGQNGWATGTAAATPIQVAGVTDKYAQINTSGQDEYKAFTSAVPHIDGNVLYTTATINVTAAQTGGDYFYHLSTPAGGNNFFQRLFARSTTGGFQLGLTDTSGTGSTIDYGTTALTLGTEYSVLVAWNFVAGGTNNDTFSVYVNPTSPTGTGDTPYVNHTWSSTSIAEPATLASVNLRQGSAGSAPTVQLDDVSVNGIVPEPTTLAALAGISMLGLRRRSR